MSRGTLRAAMQRKAQWWLGTTCDRTGESKRHTRQVAVGTFRAETKGCKVSVASNTLTNYYRDGKLVGQISARADDDVRFLLVK